MCILLKNDKKTYYVQRAAIMPQAISSKYFGEIVVVDSAISFEELFSNEKNTFILNRLPANDLK